MKRIFTSLICGLALCINVSGESAITGLHTTDDIQKTRRYISEQASPWTEAYTRLTSSGYAQASYTASPVQYLARLDATNWAQLNSRWENAGIADLWYEGIHTNYTKLMRDAAAAYQLALRYQISKDEQYATAAKQILTSWATTNKGFLRNSSGDIIDPNEYLIMIQAHEVAAAAQLLRNSDDWESTEDFAQVCSWLTNVFYPIAHDFLSNESNYGHYWLNWDLAQMTAVLSIGILCDDAEMQAEAINYFKEGYGVGNISHAVPYVYDDPDDTGETLGQCNESGRDQGHATLCAALMGTFCQMAYGIGEDLFAYDNYRAVAMAEYIAKYNVKDSDGNFKYSAESLPFTSYYYCNQQMDAISEASRGTVRPGWDIWVGYCHSHNIPCKYSDEIASTDRPDAGGGNYGNNSGGFDQLGYSTLMCYRSDASDEIDKTAVVNSTTGAEYDDIVSAWNAAAAGDVITIYKDQTISSRLTLSNSLTIIGGVDGVKIYRSNPNQMFFLAKAGSGKDLTLENIVLDGNGKSSSTVFIEADGKSNVTLNDVTLCNATITGDNGFVNAKASGKVFINNLTAENCNVDENRGIVRFGNSNSTISGNIVAYKSSDSESNSSRRRAQSMVAVSPAIFLQGANTVGVSGELTIETPITLCLDAQTDGSKVVTGYTDTNKFQLSTSDYELTESNGNLIISVPLAAAVEVPLQAIDPDAPCEYYNLQGIRIENPTSGIYICRQGAIATKVRF